jgi:hypothetical protein
MARLYSVLLAVGVLLCCVLVASPLVEAKQLSYRIETLRDFMYMAKFCYGSGTATTSSSTSLIVAAAIQHQCCGSTSSV